MSWIKCNITGELPKERAFHAAASISEDRFVMVGGRTLDQTGKEKYLNDTWIFDNSNFF